MKRFTLILTLLLTASVVMAVSPIDPYSQPYYGLMYRARLYSNVPGFSMSRMGIQTGSANNDTFYVAAYDWDADGSYSDYRADQWEGYGIDNYIAGGEFMLLCVSTGDSAAPQGEMRPITGWDSDAGMVIVSPTFTATVAQGEIIAFVHRSLLNKQKGLLRYQGTIDLLDGEASGITDGDDSLYVPDLARIYADNGWELGDYWLHFTNTTDGAAPQDEWRPVLDSDGATGCMTFTTAFTVEATTLDEVELVHYSLVPIRYTVGWSEWTEVVIDFADATWNSAATHEVITGTGDYEYEITVICSTSCSSTSSDSIWFFMGEAGATGNRMFSALLEDIDAGEGLIPITGWTKGWIWDGASDAGSNDLVNTQSGILRFAGHMGKDIGYEISDQAGAGGIITVFFRSRPLSTGGGAVAGAGGSL